MPLFSVGLLGSTVTSLGQFNAMELKYRTLVASAGAERTVSGSSFIREGLDGCELCRGDSELELGEFRPTGEFQYLQSASALL